MASRSAVIVQCRLPLALERIRAAHDPVAAMAVPAHVTILFPFVPAEALSRGVRDRLARAVASVAPFDARFERTGRFPGSLWLAPEPAEPFRELTERVARAFPDHPPYEGAHDEIVPHVTLAMGAETILDRLEDAARNLTSDRTVPIRRLVVIAEADDRRWRLRWRISLRP